MSDSVQETSDLTLQDFYMKLSERVSNYNAKLMLRTAMLNSGIDSDEATKLAKEQARAICLALIKKGGPAFQVGKDLYQRVQ